MFNYSDMKSMAKKTLKLFCKDNRIKYSGTIDELSNRIEQAVLGNSISIEAYNNWRIGVLKEGRKHVYVFSLLDSDRINELKNLGTIQELKEANNIENKDVRTIDRPETPILAFCNEQVINGQVKSVHLLYVEKKITYYPNFQTKVIDTKEINYYIFIDLLLDEKELIITLEPCQGLKEPDIDEEPDITVSTSKVALKYCDIVCELFGLGTYDNRDDYQKAIKELWNSACDINIPEIDEKIDSIQEITEAYINQCIKNLDIALGDDEDANKALLKEYSEELKDRIKNYWLKVLLNQPFDDIDVEENTLGYITAEKIRGESCQRLALTTGKDVPIHLSDYHYDVRAAVDFRGHLTYLKFTWNGLEGIDNEISTILEVFSGFFRIIFTSYSVEEEIQHVFSGIRRFKN